MGVLEGGKASVFWPTGITADPGTTCRCAVQEVGSNGAGPLSNPVSLTTR